MNICQLLSFVVDAAATATTTITNTAIDNADAVAKHFELLLNELKYWATNRVDFTEK